MKIKAKCPASCGELVQGWIKEGEKLISYPINWYSEVTIERIKATESQYDPAFQKAWQAYLYTCRYFGLTEKDMPAVSLSIASTIPVAKGMASSTADIAATVAATAHLLGEGLSPAALAKICLLMEATDSTIFPTLTLFDHLHGKCIEESNWSPEFQVLVLEPDELLTTSEYRRNQKKTNNSPYVQKAYQTYKQAVEQLSVKLLGVAATLSAVAHQNVLPKRSFEPLLKMKEHCDILGINVAHSGTVVGIMYDEKVVNHLELLNYLQMHNVLQNYPKYHLCKSVAGGVSIFEEY